LSNFIKILVMSSFETRFGKYRGERFNIFQLDVQGFCDKILSYKTLTDKQKIDSLLELDAVMYVNQGIDSTKSEIAETKKKSRVIYRHIKKIDSSLGGQLLIHQDKDS